MYLLFAHEAYFPAPGREINCSLVSAASLLHPAVRQTDGIQIHDVLTRGRRPGEIVPLATLTHELSGGSDWPKVGDWETVTVDLVQLIRTQACDGLSLCLPDVARALVCTGPHGYVRHYEAGAEGFTAFGPLERAAVLHQVGTRLAEATGLCPLWPGEGLLNPLPEGLAPGRSESHARSSRTGDAGRRYW
ncbi:hypothetical protein [Streptomyces sp. NPDC004528]|uniref:hypothetical protein n=1 Tax=Streptomyces sp. NPDC004528 TaxID=3154550 RepID=UPI00339E5F11